ncbi:UDP-glucose 4-epimerase [Vibrio coralliilyticus]|nr:UDP-glucose 4-epimerase [Vibrio coralliilyticus]
MRIAITGANGFLGSHLLPFLSEAYEVVELGRKPNSVRNDYHHYDLMVEHSLEANALNEVNVIIHTAAITRVAKGDHPEKWEKVRQANVVSTVELAKACFEAGVQRFIFISSIKVHGESTACLSPLTHDSPMNPCDDYARSKCEAECELRKLASLYNKELVIIRPPMIYGPGVKANFISLMRLVAKGLPLPFGLIKQNSRSLVSVNNLVDLILTCIREPRAANQIFLVSDNYDVSTSEMVGEMAKALGKSNRQIPVPVWCYRLVGKLLNKSDVVDRLVNSLQVDISHTEQTLSWTPPQTLQDGFKQTAESFMKFKKCNGKHDSFN